jgi:hypothetical protein
MRVIDVETSRHVVITTWLGGDRCPALRLQLSMTRGRSAAAEQAGGKEQKILRRHAS